MRSFYPLFYLPIVLGALGAGCAVDGTPSEGAESDGPTATASSAVSSIRRKLPDTPGVFTGTDFVLEDMSAHDQGPDNDTTIPYGLLGDVPIAGDWDGDGITTPGVVRGTTWILRTTNAPSSPTIRFVYGNPGDVPVVGDWDGNGTDTVGVVRGTTWYLRNSNSTGNADVSFVYGDVGDVPVVGDWNGDGQSDPGVVRGGSHWFLRNSQSCCNADITFTFGAPGMTPVVGDWDGDGIDTPGMFENGTWYLANHDLTEVAETTFLFGAPGHRPVTGRWIAENPLPYRGGPIMTTPTIYLVYYGNWTAAQETLVTQYVAWDLPESSLGQLLTSDYYDSSGRHPAPIKLGGSLIDRSYSVGKSLDWAHLAQEVDLMISRNWLANDPNGIYMVLESSDLAPVNAGECGSHSTTDSGHVYGYVYDAGCTVNSDCNAGATCVAGACSDGKFRSNCLTGNAKTSPNGDVGVDAMLSALTHEIAEATTDPHANGWVGSRVESETGDLCAYDTGTTFTVSEAQANLAVNGHDYLVQQLFNPKTNFCSMTP